MNAQPKTSFYQEVGFRLKQVRSRNRVSQEQMGMRTGTSRQAVQRYEMGENPIPCIVVDAYAREFNTPVGFFYGEIHKEPDRAALLIAQEVTSIQDATVRKCLYHLTGAIRKMGRAGG